MEETSVSARHVGPYFVTVSEDVIDRLLRAERATIAVYLVLRRECSGRRDGWFWKGGHVQIGTEAGVSEASVKRAVRWLVAEGLIKVEVRTGRRGQLSHRYEIPQLGTLPSPPLCVRCGSPWHVAGDCERDEVVPAGSPMTTLGGSPVTRRPGHPRPGHGLVTGDPAEVDKGGKSEGGRTPLTPGGSVQLSEGAEGETLTVELRAEVFLPQAIGWVRSLPLPDRQRVVGNPTHGDALNLLQACGRGLPAGTRNRRRVAAAALRMACAQLAAEVGSSAPLDAFNEAVRVADLGGELWAMWWRGWVAPSLPTLERLDLAPTPDELTVEAVRSAFDQLREGGLGTGWGRRMLHVRHSAQSRNHAEELAHALQLLTDGARMVGTSGLELEPVEEE